MGRIRSVKLLLSPALLASLLMPLLSGPALAQSPDGLKKLDDAFPWTAPLTPDAWQIRARQVRQQTQVALGLWPMPRRTELKAVQHGRVERPDFTVDRVIFESMPGCYVTGSLYRPKPGQGAPAKDGRHPAVLLPHGHFAGGRFQFESDAVAAEALASGAEKFEAAARRPLQARCIQLVRMGCIVFHFDMAGYADSTQLDFDLIHRYRTPRPDMQGAEGWGFYSAAAEGWNQSPVGLQTWNAIRAVDFLTSLPDVDPARIGVTGASGGGTQTFLLAALDSRIAAAVPAVMVSTGMQGGCTCENATGLRIGTGNVELAALFAPKPLGLITANDWTVEMPVKGYPQLAELWARLGSPDNIQLFHHPEFQHNSNGVSSAGMYAWFNQHLGLGLPATALAERDFQPLTNEEITVWSPEHPAPTGDATGPAFEKHLLSWWKNDATAQIAKDPAIARAGWETLLGRTLDTTGTAFSLEVRAISAHPGHRVQEAILTNETFQEKIPFVLIQPLRPATGSVLWLEDSTTPTAAVMAQVQAGRRVIMARLRSPGLTQNAQVVNNSPAPCYTYGYNYSLLVKRVHDALSLIQYFRATPGSSFTSLDLVGRGPAVPVATAAAAFSPSACRSIDLEKTSFRFSQIRDPWDPQFLPGALRYGDLPALRQMAGLAP